MSRTTPQHLGDRAPAPVKNNAIVAKEDAARQAAWAAAQNARERFVMNAILLAAIIALIVFAVRFQP